MTAPNRWLICIAFMAISEIAVAAAEEEHAVTPMPRPKLTESLRAKAEASAGDPAPSHMVTMDKFVVREGRLPSSPPEEHSGEGKFSITEGGYVLKKDGAKFSTEVGLWRHISVVPKWDETRDQNLKLRMGVLRFSW